MSGPRFSVCVYCGSRPGALPAYADAAAEVGRLIGAAGGRLVYGGGRSGLMGVVADATLAAGGEVVGIIPRSLMDREHGHTGLTELHVVETMHERKQMMAERADAFLTLPGGIGTFEELFETWTWLQLGYHAKPVGLLDVAGYYGPLRQMLAHTVQQGFFSPQQHDTLLVDESAERLLQRLRAACRGNGEDYSRI
ncbi:MAG: TIGR00730 family Rossman fold protein [Burkholderiales bacterium]|nr:TIGR00730 family Rossman fold protein [Burkholderiales bacterium]